MTKRGREGCVMPRRTQQCDRKEQEKSTRGGAGALVALHSPPTPLCRHLPVPLSGEPAPFSAPPPQPRGCSTHGNHPRASLQHLRHEPAHPCRPPTQPNCTLRSLAITTVPRTKGSCFTRAPAAARAHGSRPERQGRGRGAVQHRCSCPLAGGAHACDCSAVLVPLRNDKASAGRKPWGRRRLKVHGSTGGCHVSCAQGGLP